MSNRETQIQSSLQIQADKGWRDIQGIADRYSVVPKTIREWVASKKIPATKISRRCVRFNVEACDQALSRFSDEIR